LVEGSIRQMRVGIVGLGNFAHRKVVHWEKAARRCGQRGCSVTLNILLTGCR
jgi:hypothetical protein